MLDSIATAVGVKKGVVIAAFIGAALASLIGPKKDWRAKTLSFLVGFASAVYLTSPVLSYFDLKAGDYEGGIGFMLGLFGMSLADKALTLIGDITGASIASLFKRK